MADSNDQWTDPKPSPLDGIAPAWSSEEMHTPSGERILNQEEIDSLLGFDLNGENDGDRTGIRAIINSALVSYERLPMLEIVFDRLVRLMTTSLRNFTSDNVEVSLDNISSIRFGDYLNSIPLPAILAVFRAEELDNFGMLTVDSNLIYSIVDVLLGGRRGTAAMRIEGRPYTTIERVLVQRMVEVVLADAKAAFEPLTPVEFTLDRLETNPRFAAIARPANAAILVKLRIDMGEKFGRDNIWEGHLATELWTTQTEVRAVLDEQQMGLKKVLELKVGDTMMLNATPDSLVELRAGPISLTHGRMGRRNQSIAVRCEAPLTPHAKQAVQRLK
jgi:flagellar motor switch protein FliM